ncbi:hypothetical protein LZG04_39550 [Saccharothrix sp. S26]|uniref:hypothetical protein n=1 Tax=Saccharothrix sp. S26 TaxID=2907215 RepID=UPI001F195F83|nr:hypothetical protein [Saccharothrix sp. S26]MCE7000870.1 hypothetical protein [Saccharothrix sp. S26]
MTEHRQHLTTEDFAERTPADRTLTDRDPADRDPADRDLADREPVEQTPADRDVAEPDLTDQERFDREPTQADERTAHEQPDGYPQDAGYHDSGYHDSGFGAPARDEHTAQAEPAVNDEPVEPSSVDTTAGDAPLFTTEDAADYQAEWRALQADFVDDPREAVQRADELVAQVMQTLATTFNEHKHALEEQWQRGDEVQTEELRQALKRYRTFFDRLLSV